jgi:cellulose synthase/poly-beta-1,6-N-acetylglucosamine synthase-like glycosyltransferase
VLFWRNAVLRHLNPLKTSITIHDWPEVLVQLPIFNERMVARRLIKAVARMDYPADRLHIQILDDSTDTTRELVDKYASYSRKRGIHISVLRRGNRNDYKAGALRYGLASTREPFVAIFDADFFPDPDWLKRAMKPFFEPNGEHIGLVQTRWAHLNDDYSVLTRAQALALDGHFGIEQYVRHDSGLFFNFNGTAGIWRRACIEDAGNWRGSTLAEDLDLSYRAQIRGWKIRYLPDLTAPAELPTLMVGFKRQQYRWAKGSIQVIRLLGRSLASARINPWKKYQAFLHLSSYLVHPLMLLLLVLTLPLTILDGNIQDHLPIGWLGFLSIGPPLFYATSQWALYRDKPIWRWLTRMPWLAMLGVGIAVNNSRAVIAGLRDRPNVFERTPKTGITQQKQTRRNLITETFPADPGLPVEVFLCFYLFVLALLAIHQQNWLGALFFLLYAAGFGWVAVTTYLETRATQTASQKSLRLVRSKEIKDEGHHL